MFELDFITNVSRPGMSGSFINLYDLPFTLRKYKRIHQTTSAALKGAKLHKVYTVSEQANAVHTDESGFQNVNMCCVFSSFLLITK